MKYLKTYEKKKYDKTLFSCDYFRIVKQGENDCLSYYSIYLAASAIIMMSELVYDKSKHINDEKLRNIPIREKDIRNQLGTFDDMERRIPFLKEYKNGEINRFTNIDTLKSLPDNVYADLCVEYYPIIINAIKKSKTLGDVIDNFKPIVKEINEIDFEMLVNVNKYNM